jgi:AraC family transcriptional regulator, regulatory protein of adaptative response / methylated-DNA-[protein]-cysteine methyltransferase
MRYITQIETPVGMMVAAATESGICILEFSDKKRIKTGNEYNEAGNVHLNKLKKELREYFSGKRKEFTVPLDPEGTPFQKQVWQALCTIPFGSTVSYYSLAETLGNPLSVRAVANANARNPVSVIIPCHRVIGGKGNLTGYAGGLWRKKWLIEHENKYSGKPVSPELFDMKI